MEGAEEAAGLKALRSKSEPVSVQIADLQVADAPGLVGRGLFDTYSSRNEPGLERIDVLDVNIEIGGIRAGSLVFAQEQV